MTDGGQGKAITLAGKRTPICVLIVAVGVTLALVLSAWMRQREQDLLARTFEGRADDRVVAIERAFDNALISVESVAAFLQASPDVDRTRFGSIAGQFLDRFDYLQGMGWNRVVVHADRAEHEESTRREGFADYQIVERNADGDIVRAADRPQYVVVHFVEPMAGNEKAFGFDVASEVVRRTALDEARATGRMTATGALRLVQETGSAVGILVCAPVHRGGDTANGLQGFAVGVFRVGPIVDQALRDFESEDVALSIQDLGNVGGGLMYGTPDAGGIEGELLVETTIAVAGRSWRIECRPTASFLAGESMWGSVAALWAVLLLTALIAGYVYGLTGKNVRLRNALFEQERTRSELVAADAWMQLALGAIDGGIWDLDVESGQMHISSGWLKRLGRDVETSHLSLSTWEEWIHPEDRPRVAAARQRQVEGDSGTVSVEYRMRTASGEWIWLLDRGQIVEPVGDRPSRIAGTALDITQRKLDEESVVQLSLAVENAMTGVSRLDVDGTFVMVREGYAAMLGYAPEEMIGLSWTETVQEGDLDKGRAAYGTMLEEGRGETVAHARRKDGSMFFKHILLVQIKDEDGTHAGHYCFMRDVTKQTEAEAAVRLRDRAIRSVSNGIVITDATQPDHPIVFVNEAFERMTGYAAAEVIGRNCRFLQKDERDQPGRHELRSAIADRQEARVVLRNYRKDGSTFWNEIYVAPVLSADGELTHYVGVQIDVTEREEAEAEKARVESERRHSQKLEAVGTLASGIAHDFNNLLTAIEGHTDCAADGLDADHAARLSLDQVKRACEQATVVTRSLLTFSNQADADQVPTDLVTVGAEALGLIEPLLPASIEVHQDLPDHGVWVEGDRGQLKQVLVNLVINARDAMPEGGELRVELTVDAATDRAVFVIADSGSGMSEDTAARVFEPFFTTKQREKGTGLGLAIVHGIVTDHRGRIEVETTQGRGSRFRIELPMCVPPSVDRRDDIEPPRSVDDPGRGELILVAEDNELVRPLLAKALNRHGYDVVCAEDGEEAVELFEEHESALSLVVLDLDLPKRSGLECLELMRTHRSDLPVVIVSGDCDRWPLGDQEPRMQVLAKPFRMPELQQAVEGLLASAR